MSRIGEYAYVWTAGLVVLQVALGRESWLPLATAILTLVFAARVHRTSLTSVAFTLGLAFSIAGDSVDNFLIKMALFAVVHVAYIVALRPSGQPPLRLAIAIPGSAVVGAAIGLVASLSGPLWPAVMGYGLLILIMATLAGARSRTALGGAVAFMVSDLLISLQAVRPELESNGLSAVAVGLYLAAQGCLAAAVIKEENA